MSKFDGAKSAAMGALIVFAIFTFGIGFITVGRAALKIAGHVMGCTP